MQEVLERLSEAVRSANCHILKFSACSIFRELRYLCKNKIINNSKNVLTFDFLLFLSLSMQDVTDVTESGMTFRFLAKTFCSSYFTVVHDHYLLKNKITFRSI